MFEKVKAGEITVGKAEKQLFPTAKEKAKKDPAVRWMKLLSDIQIIINSKKTLGGMRQLARLWTDEQKKYYRDTLLDVSKRLKGYAEEL